MAKAGATTNVGTTTTDSGKEFSGNAVEGQKGASEEAIDPDTIDPVDPPAADPIEPPAVDPVDPPAADPIEPPAVDPVDPPAADPVDPPAAEIGEDTSYVVTHRDGCLKKIYFRHGKEIGSENV